jgi:protein AATF/BFR2
MTCQSILYTDCYFADFDPEDESAFRSGSEDSGSDDEATPGAAREHYETVGKSNLRKPQAVSLGPQYAGTKVRRDAISDDEEDDPFTRDFGESESEGDEDDDEEEDVGSSDEEVDGARAKESGNSSDEDEENEEDDTDLTDDDMEEDSAFQSDRRQADTVDRTELRKLLADDSKSVAANLSQSMKDDAAKGRAVKQQRTTFDTLLNSRIKLQKALVAINSLLTVEEDDEATAAADVLSVADAAEAAALALWNNLIALRMSLQDSQSNGKRSHKEFSEEDSLDTMWEESKTYESAQKKQRTTTLDYWASRTRSATASLPHARGRLQQAVKEQTLSDVLTGQLADMSRHVAKTRVPRSCAPVQAATASKNGPATADGEAADDEDKSVPIYDDADFYSTLLANLISQRSADTAVNLSNLSLQPWQAAREAKTKKIVDTKASKGRKLRYTVHEKLVSFMAPEDRGTWAVRQADELFGSLFGRRLELAERQEDVEMEEDREVEGLRLFGGR